MFTLNNPLRRLMFVLTIAMVAFVGSDFVAYHVVSSQQNYYYPYPTATTSWLEAMRNPMPYYGNMVDYVVMHVIGLVVAGVAVGFAVAVLRALFLLVCWIIFGTSDDEDFVDTPSDDEVIN